MLLESEARNVGTPFRAGREAVTMFLRGSFPVFSSWPSTRIVLGNTAVRSEIYRRFCREQGLVRTFCANGALYAEPAKALSSKVSSEVVDLASGDVVQLVRTLPCHPVSSITSVISVAYGKRG